MFLARPAILGIGSMLLLAKWFLLVEAVNGVVSKLLPQLGDFLWTFVAEIDFNPFWFEILNPHGLHEQWDGW